MISLDKQEIDLWIHGKELKLLKSLLKEIVERYDEFPVAGLPYSWTTEKELKEIYDRIKTIMNSNKKFCMGGVARYNVGYENTFILSIVFSNGKKKAKAKTSQNMIIVAINEDRKFNYFQMY